MKKVVFIICSLFLAGNLMSQVDVVFNVDMTEAENFNPSTDDIYIASDFTGWQLPGSNPDLKMEPTLENPMIYTWTYQLSGPMTIQYKYYIIYNNIPSWENGEWIGDPNRTIIIMGDNTLDDIWADMPVFVTFNVDMTNADPFDPTHDDVYITGSLMNGWTMPGSITGYKLTPDPENQNIYALTRIFYKGTCDYKYFRVIDGVPSWDNGEWIGPPNRIITIETEMTVNDIWGIIGTTGILDIQSFTVIAYPNPVKDILNLENLIGADKIEIYNVMGERVLIKTRVTDKTLSINTSGFCEGIYFVNVYQSQSVRSIKFIKE